MPDSASIALPAWIIYQRINVGGVRQPLDATSMQQRVEFNAAPLLRPGFPPPNPRSPTTRNTLQTQLQVQTCISTIQADGRIALSEAELNSRLESLEWLYIRIKGYSDSSRVYKLTYRKPYYSLQQGMQPTYLQQAGTAIPLKVLRHARSIHGYCLYVHQSTSAMERTHLKGRSNKEYSTRGGYSLSYASSSLSSART